MQNFKISKGGDTERIELDATMDDNGNVVSINSAIVYAFGGTAHITPETDVRFHNGLITYLENRYKEIKRYRKLEKSFLEVLRDTIIIETEEKYLMALKEYNSRTKDMNDDGMNDQNGSVNSFK